jgi:DNA-binding GntR family transcriptional regulator
MAKKTTPLRRKRSRKALPDGNSAVDSIIEHVKDGIRQGRYAPGQRLIEGDLQEVVGTSRGPIREAMRRLAAESLVELEHHKGARVRRLSAQEIVAVYQVREALEGYACRLAASHIDEADHRARLQAIEAEFDRSFNGSPNSYLRYNERFHRLIVGMSGNAHLIRLVEQLQLRAFILLVHVIVDTVSAKRARAEHRPIVKALMAKDADKAERAMRAHVRNTCRFVLRETAARLAG